MAQAEILTPWGLHPNPELGNYPLVGLTHTLDSWSDTTGQEGSHLPTSPNLVVILAQAESDVLDAIEADPDYEVLTRDG